ncbi:MAG: dTDP-4-dehydrorhamnose 3,5-epimerase [Saprospiraceae bacterium]|nr:dTDP-4-dehydrorhamnose 3,5-epimerase [Saprospiraceae bacterium]
MKFIETSIPGLVLIEPIVYRDDRGYFFESYQKAAWQSAGIYCTFVQDNEAYSRYGAVRGLHYQLPPFQQDKLVRVIHGEVLDVVIDIRPQAATYGQHFSAILSDANKRQLFIPAGFAHGYATLSDTAIFAYKCSQYYSRDHEAGIGHDDPQLNIDWQIPNQNRIISPKDQQLPPLGQHLKWPQA